MRFSGPMDDRAKRERNVMMDLTSDVCFRLDGTLSANTPRTFVIAAALAAAIAGGTANAAATLDQAPYGTTQGGQAVDIFTMTNDHGLRVRFLSYGGIITEIDVPDRRGRLDDIVLGLKTLRDYETLPGHFGAIIRSGLCHPHKRQTASLQRSAMSVRTATRISPAR